MNSTAIKEAIAIGYPREQMYGVWWSGAEPDVTAVGERRQGLQRAGVAARRRARPEGRQGHDQVPLRQGPGHRARRRKSAGALQPRHDLGDADRRERCKRAQGKYGKQRRDRRGSALGRGEPGARPKSSRRSASRASCSRSRPRCVDHGARAGRASTPGTARSGRFTSDWYEADEQILKPMIEAAAEKYAAEKKLTRRKREDCQTELRSRLPMCALHRSGAGLEPGRSESDIQHGTATRHPARRQRHRGDLQPRDPRAEGRVAHGARGRHRRAARRQRRRQDHDAEGDLQPAARASAAR